MRLITRFLALATLFISTSALGQDKYYQKGVGGSDLENGGLFEDWAANNIKIGLGTITPKHRLEIRGDPSNLWPGEIAISNAQGAVVAATAIGSLLFRTYDTTVADCVVAAIDAVASGTFDSSYHQTDIVFRTSYTMAQTAVERMRLHYDGNLSIGSSTHTNYKLYVNGTIYSRGIRTYANDIFTGVVLGAPINSINSNQGATIGGGGSEVGPNTITSSFMGLIDGGYNNTIESGDYAVIGGGSTNVVSSLSATVSGGQNNSIDTGSSYAVISGGYGNALGADTSGSVIGGGYGNTMNHDSRYSVIAGGLNNSITTGSYDDLYYNSIVGGTSNAIGIGDYNFIGGGYDNYASSDYNTVPGGYQNSAGGGHAFAAGYKASAGAVGSFVWSSYGNGSCISTTMNQFKVCAIGGAWFSHGVSAASFTDRTPYPSDLGMAYEAVLSMQRLPDGQYDLSDEANQLDHSSLTPFVAVDYEDGSRGRNLSATVSAQNEVIKSLIERVTLLELEISALKARIR